VASLVSTYIFVVDPFGVVLVAAEQEMALSSLDALISFCTACAQIHGIAICRHRLTG